MIIDLIFNSVNFFVLLFWVLIIFLFNWKVICKIMEFFIFFILLVVVYFYLFISSFIFEFAVVLFNFILLDIVKFFGEELAVVIGWVYFLVMDLFVGCWIYWEG